MEHRAYGRNGDVFAPSDEVAGGGVAVASSVQTHLPPPQSPTRAAAYAPPVNFRPIDFSPVGPGVRTRYTGHLLVGALVLILFVAAGVTFLSNTGGSNGDADAAVVTAATSTLADQTATYTLSGAIKIGSESVPLSGSGAVDFPQNAFRSQFGFQIPGSVKLTENAIAVGNTVYFNIGDLVGQLLPCKTWVSANVSQLTDGSSNANKLGVSGSTLDTNPEGELRLLEQQGNTATDLGPSTVSGVPVEGYSVTLNLAAIKSAIASEHLPSWMTPQFNSISDAAVTYTVFITKGNLLAGVTASGGLTLQGQPVTVTLSEYFSNFGQPVSIAAPSADQVAPLQSFLRAIPSNGGSSLD